MTADEGDYAVAGYMEQVLGLDKTNDGTTLGNRPDGIHRVQLMTNGTGNDPLYFQLMGTEAEAPGALMNTPFTYTYEGTTRTLPRKYRQASIPQGHAIKAGDWAKYNATTNLPGTAGWNLRLMNGTTAGVVCMSAFHAISPTPTPDPVNPPRVQLYTAGGAAPAANAWVWYYRQLVLPPNDNLFDLALARYDFPQQADNMCVVCPAGSPHAVQPYDYPVAIARNVATSASNTSSELYHRTGGSTPCCGEGQCIGVGAAAAVNLWGTRYLFRSCLVFDPIATVGDSGAIMVRNSDGKAAGLHFCGDPPSQGFAGDAISCRLELLGWARQADFQVPGGVLLPTFQQ